MYGKLSGSIISLELLNICIYNFYLSFYTCTRLAYYFFALAYITYDAILELLYEVI